MSKVRMFKIFIIGTAIMTAFTTSANDLRPSQQKSLNSILDKIKETQVIIDQGGDLENLESLKARGRVLAKTQKSLVRMEKSLRRFPSHADVAYGLTQIDNLNNEASIQSAEIKQMQDSLTAKQANDKQAFRQMLAADQTQNNIKRMKELASIFLRLDAYLASTNGRLTHFIYKSINQQPVREAIELLMHADELVDEANLLNNKYAEFIANSGTGSLSFNLKDMVIAKEKYQSSKPKFINLFPAVQIKAVDVLKGSLDEIMRTNYNRDMFDENSSNKTSIQLDKARVVVQAEIFEALVGGEASEVLHMRDQVMSYWEKVKTETDFEIYLKSKEEHHNKSWLTDDSSENNE